MKDVSSSTTPGEAARRLSANQTLINPAESFVLRQEPDSPMTESGQSDGANPQIKKLQEEIAEYQQGLEKWMEAEAEWNHQRRLFKVMTENVTDLIVLTDRGGSRLWNNPAYGRALNRESGEIAGTSALAEVHPDDQARATAALEEAASRSAKQQVEYRIQRKSGEWLWLQTEIIPVLTPEGRVEILVFTSRDISETKRLNEALTLASSQSAAAGMIENMARDFDQILTSLFGNLTIARDLNGPRNAVAIRLSEMERSLQLARNLIEKLFSLSSTAEQPRTRMSIEPLVHEAATSVLRATMVRAEYTFVRNLPEVEINAEVFTHAVRALVTNSLQAMDKGVIRISAEFVPQARLAARPEIPLRAGDYVCLIIQDQGHGMTDKVLPRAFEPHFTTRKGSQGIGLTTALSAIQRQGGTIVLDSTPSVGTTAYLYLPAGRATTAPRVNMSGAVALPKSSAKKRILLMDDEQMILDIVSRMLIHLGYEVVTCPEGAQAIAAFTKAKSSGQPFDVVLMDLVIPQGVGGQDAVHTIRKIDPTAKVIASSGHLEHPAMVDHKKFGFVATLEKPYKLERLQQVIEAVIDSSALS